MNTSVSQRELRKLAQVEEFGPLYAARKKVYPQSVFGKFRRIKWALMAFCLGVYYFLPFVRWHRGLGAPDQAVLIDFPNRRFYFFFIELWPQEVYYFTGLLIIAAVALFLMNAVGGRMRRGLPDRHRYSQRPAARMHPVRPVHRRLRQCDEEDRPGKAPDRI